MLILSSVWDWGLGLGTGVGDWGWGLGLETGFGDWDWGWGWEIESTRKKNNDQLDSDNNNMGEPNMIKEKVIPNTLYLMELDTVVL